MSISGPIGASIPERRAPGLALALATLALLAGCAEIKSRLPHRTPPARPAPATVPAKPKPPVPAKPEPATAGGFLLLAPATAERDRIRVRQALAAADREALAPDDVGYFLDVLQGRLRQVAGARVPVARRGNRLVLDLSRAVGFEPAGPKLGPGADETTAPLGRLLAEYRQLLVTVRVSPVDAAAGDDPALAQRRAVALAQRFADAGVAKKRVLVVGTANGRLPPGADARVRVEVQLEPLARAATAPKSR